MYGRITGRPRSTAASGARAETRRAVRGRSLDGVARVAHRAVMASDGAAGAGGAEEMPSRDASPFTRSHSTASGDEKEPERELAPKFASLSVDTNPSGGFEGRELRHGIMIVGKRIRGALKKKGTSGFRLYKDRYFMLHNGKMLMFESERQYMSGYIPTPEQTTYVNLYDLDEMKDDKKFSFRLCPKHVSAHTKHILVFRAPSEGAKEVWLNSLESVPDLVVMTPQQADLRKDSGDGSDGSDAEPSA